MSNHQSFEILKDYINSNSDKIFLTREIAISFYINNLFKTKRDNKYLTCQKIADEAFMDKAEISRISNGQKHPSKYVWFRIGMVGNYDLEYMNGFMNAAGYSFGENNAVDVILRYAVLKKMSWDGIYQMFKNFPRLFMNRKLMKEIFGGYLEILLTE